MLKGQFARSSRSTTRTVIIWNILSNDVTVPAQSRQIFKQECIGVKCSSLTINRKSLYERVTLILKGQFVCRGRSSSRAGKFGISYQMTSQFLLKVGKFSSKSALG